MKTKKKTPKYNGRDLLILELIKGATKAGVQPDRRKKADKERCRAKVRRDEE